MKKLFPPLGLIVFIVTFASIAAADSGMRPALIGNGRYSLVNQINTGQLMAHGATDAAVYFSCAVSSKGEPDEATVYRGTPGSKALADAVTAAMPRSRFIPALYNGHSVSVWFCGAAVFFVVDGKPRLRVYANQNQDDIAKGADFVAPQLILGTENWEAAKQLLERARISVHNGAVEMEISVDENGRNKGMKVISEDPAGYNFGRAILAEYKDAFYVPGFRNGHLVSSSFHYTDYVYAYARLTRTSRLNPTHIGPQ